jgi:hypothetical protein
MAFSLGNVTFEKSDYSTGVYAMSGIKYLSFSDFTTGIVGQQKQESITNFITYPNPVNDLLIIDLSGSDDNSSSSSSSSISILSFEGKMMYEQKNNCLGIVKLNLSQLPKGIYLCRYRNATKIKTEKIIKQ